MLFLWKKKPRIMGRWTWKKSVRWLLILILIRMFLNFVVYVYEALFFRSLQASNNLLTLKDLEYIPMNFSAVGEITADKVVVHVTKEFHNGKYGGIGTLLTSLVDAQCRSEEGSNGRLTTHVIMPLYSFLLELDRPVRVGNVDLAIQFRDPTRGHVLLKAPIYAKLLRQDKESPSQCSLVVWYVGKPFGPVLAEYPELGDVFDADGPRDIYPEAGKRKHKLVWRDLYFGAVIQRLLTDPIFHGSSSKTRPVQHVHGATNAISINPKSAQKFHAVYTFHDDSFEFEYEILCKDYRIFFPEEKETCRTRIPDLGYAIQNFPAPESSSIDQMIDVVSFRPSILGIAFSDRVTTVSNEILDRLLDDSITVQDFPVGNVLHFSQWLLDGIRRLLKSKLPHAHAVSNGLSLIAGDLTNRFDPFSHPSLVQRNLNYKWPLSGPNIQDTKNRIKHLLVCDPDHHLANILNSTLYDLDNDNNQDYEYGDIFHPKTDDSRLFCKGTREIWILFVGRFTLAKGIDLLTDLKESILADMLLDGEAYGVRIILMGQIFDEMFFRALVRDRQEKHPLASRILVNVMSSERKQSQFGALIRAASDISWVPSRNEAFGLVGLEALLFGMPVITSGVGGMQEYLRHQDLDDMIFRHRINRHNFRSSNSLENDDEYDFLVQGKKFLTSINHCQNVYLGTGDSTREIVRRSRGERNSKFDRNNTFSGACFRLLDDPPFHFNSFVFTLDSSKELSQYNAWSKFTRIHRWMDQNPEAQEVFQWSCIASALSKLWNRKPDGSLVQYSSIYEW